MLSNFLRRKLKYYFNLFDQDDDQVLARADFARFLDRLTLLRGLAAGAPAYDQLAASHMGWWQAFASSGDSLTRDAYYAFWEKFHAAFVQEVAHGTGPIQQQLTRTADLILKAFDTNGDGQLDLAEYSAFAGALGLNHADEIEEAYLRLDVDEDNAVTREQLHTYIIEFFTGDDALADGTWLYGLF